MGVLGPTFWKLQQTLQTQPGRPPCRHPAPCRPTLLAESDRYLSSQCTRLHFHSFASGCAERLVADMPFFLFAK